MNKEELRLFAKNKITTSPLGYRKTLIKYENEIKSYVPLEISDFRILLFHFIHELNEQPLCEVCGKKPANFKNISHGYGRTCSVQCAAHLSAEGLAHVDQAARMVKQKATNLERYGVEFPLQRKESREKFKETMIARHGAEYPIQNKDIAKKTKETMLSRYGQEYYFGTKHGKDISSNGMLRYHASQFYKNYYQKKYQTENWKYLEKYLIDVFSDKNALEFYENPEQYLDGRKRKDIATDIKISTHLFNRVLELRNIEYTAKKSARSSFEIEIVNFISSIYSGEIISGDQTLLSGQLEIDIYIPEKNLAIECNGLYWHSDKFRNENYHNKKFEECARKNIQLLQITDKSFRENSSVWKSIISSKIGKNIKISKELVSFISITAEQADRFFDENSLNKSSIKPDLILSSVKDTEILSVVTFSKISSTEWKLLRHCDKIGYDTDGFSKIITHFESNIMKSGEVLFAETNRFLSNGSEFVKNNFMHHAYKKPEYLWTNGGELFSTQDILNENIIEKDIEDFMRNTMKMNKFYDAGNDIWILSK